MRDLQLYLGKLTLLRAGHDMQADCEYHCMQRLEAARAAQNLPRLKYHGKWCFTRVLGAL